MSKTTTVSKDVMEAVMENLKALGYEIKIPTNGKAKDVNLTAKAKKVTKKPVVVDVDDDDDDVVDIEAEKHNGKAKAIADLEKQTRSARAKAKSKYAYGQAVTPDVTKKMVIGGIKKEVPDALKIHKARVAQLENEIEGISDAFEIFSTGIDARKIDLKGASRLIVGDLDLHKANFRFMCNSPFTSIRLPSPPRREDFGNDKKFKAAQKNYAALEVGGKKIAEIRAIVASCGYKYSSKNEVWACDCKGRPVQRKGSKALGAIKDAYTQSDDE